MQFKYFSSPSRIYHKLNLSPVRQSEIFQVQVQWFLKIKFHTLMNAFDETFALAFYNSFLKNKN